MEPAQPWLGTSNHDRQNPISPLTQVLEQRAPSSGGRQLARRAVVSALNPQSMQTLEAIFHTSSTESRGKATTGTDCPRVSHVQSSSAPRTQTRQSIADNGPSEIDSPFSWGKGRRGGSRAPDLHHARTALRTQITRSAAAIQRDNTVGM